MWAPQRTFGVKTLLGITRDGVNKAIRRLKIAGVIRRVGPDKGGHWEIVKPTIANERSEPKVD